jgi:hypothetical protein
MWSFIVYLNYRAQKLSRIYKEGRTGTRRKRRQFFNALAEVIRASKNNAGSKARSAGGIADIFSLLTIRFEFQYLYGDELKHSLNKE